MSSLFYSKISRVSRVRAITDTCTGDEKRRGEVPTLGLSYTKVKPKTWLRPFVNTAPELQI